MWDLRLAFGSASVLVFFLVPFSRLQFVRLTTVLTLVLGWNLCFFIRWNCVLPLSFIYSYLVFFFVLVEDLTLKSKGYRLWCVLNHLEVCAYPWSPPIGVSRKVDLRHLEFFPGGSDSGGAEILAFRFSAAEDRRESVDNISPCNVIPGGKD